MQVNQASKSSEIFEAKSCQDDAIASCKFCEQVCKSIKVVVSKTKKVTDLQTRVARFFLVQDTKTGENISN
jgi:hypothetical protein